MVNKAIRVARARAPVRLASYVHVAIYIYVSIAGAYVTHALAVSSTPRLWFSACTNTN